MRGMKGRSRLFPFLLSSPSFHASSLYNSNVYIVSKVQIAVQIPTESVFTGLIMKIFPILKTFLQFMLEILGNLSNEVANINENVKKYKMTSRGIATSRPHLSAPSYLKKTNKEREKPKFCFSREREQQSMKQPNLHAFLTLNLMFTRLHAMIKKKRVSVT